MGAGGGRLRTGLHVWGRWVGEGELVCVLLLGCVGGVGEMHLGQRRGLEFWARGAWFGHLASADVVACDGPNLWLWYGARREFNTVAYS